MGREIERKFLVAGDAWRGATSKSERIVQGYVMSGDGMSLRVRIVDGRDAVITLKTNGNDISRGEYEYAIPLKDARELMELAGKRLVQKNRHTIAVAGKDWVIDEFAGRHAGLLLAELELASDTEAFEKPDWVGEEVTGIAAYSNAKLAET